jgi:hypothetical protein
MGITNGTNSVAGFVVQKTGGKVVSIQSITARGQSSLTSQWSSYFLDSPAGFDALDTGLAFTVNFAAGKASAVQSVSVEAHPEGALPVLFFSVIRRQLQLS